LSGIKGGKFGAIADRLDGASILVSGATGFLAKVFVEKLLRSVPSIRAVHLLVRPRSDGTTARQRIRREVIDSAVFDRLRATLGTEFERLIEQKVHAVAGDLTESRFGLTDEEYDALAKNINLVVNSAATVTFDERLDLALSLNTLGPQRCLQFARDCGNAPYLQVSTCYVSGTMTGEIPEALIPDGHTIRSYKSSMGNGKAEQKAQFVLDDNINKLRNLVTRTKENNKGAGAEVLRRAMIDAGMEQARAEGWNDTYTYTKWLGEKLLDRNRGDVPLVIFRPAIIESSYDEPGAGWIDGLRMADPLILAFGKGKLREFPALSQLPLDLIPVDFVANAMIAALPCPQENPGLKVYQCCSSSRHPISIGQMIKSIETAFKRDPMIGENGKPIRVSTFDVVRLEEFLRRWNGRLNRAKRIRKTLEKLNLASHKRAQLAAAESRITQLIYFAKIYAPYTHLDCRFRDDHLRDLFQQMSESDRDTFPFDVARVDWRDYIERRHIPGLRKFVLGAGLEPASKVLASRDKLEPEATTTKHAQHSLQAKTIFEVFERSAKQAPDKIAIQMRRAGRWMRYTYAEALAATGTIARRFAEFGLSRGDRVAIYSENGPEWGLAYLAAMRAGLTAVPLDPQLPSSDVRAMTKFAKAKLICAGNNTYEKIKNTDPMADGENCPVVKLATPFIPPPGASQDIEHAPVEVSQDHIASILFTSGTTVAPKAVALTNKNFLANARSLIRVQPIHKADEFLSVLPMYHVFEFTGGFFVPIASGSTITYVENLKGPEIVDMMRATGTTVMMVVPRLLKLFYDAITRKIDDASTTARIAVGALRKLSNLSGHRLGKPLFGKVHREFGGRVRMFVSGGSALDSTIFLGFKQMGFNIYEGYGLTETAPVLTLNPPRRARAGSCGQPIPGVEIDIRNQNAHSIGELWVKGPNVMNGYLEAPDKTDEVIRDGWFRTGDLGKRDSDGFIYITGRAKDLIVTPAGKNVYPDEVEIRYADLPYVKELCVLAMPTDDGIGEAVHAVAVLDTDAEPSLDHSSMERTAREAASAIAEFLPSHQRIQKFHFWESDLPKTSTFKAKRNEIRDRLLRSAQGDELAELAAPAEKPVVSRTGIDATPAAESVRKLLAKLTRKPENAIQLDWNLLLDLGVDSLMKIQVLSEIESTYGLEIDDDTAITVARVSDLIRLIGDRQPLTNGNRKSSAQRLHDRVTTDSKASHNTNGQSTTILAPVRWALRGSVGMFFHTYVRVEVEGLQNVPDSGGFLIAPNHSSHLDSAAVSTAVSRKRKLYIAGAQDYFFNSAVKRWFFGEVMQTIPFDRDADGLEGLRRCGEVVRNGEGLLLFPEGTRSVTGRIQNFKIGVAVLATEHNVPIIPTRIERTYDLLPKGSRWIKPGTVRVIFAPPIHPEPIDPENQFDQFRILTEKVQQSVESIT
jgi:long-chain acyl-CoA synthetase